ncbi:hypothetical protein NMY22_g12298 [Coprinellus aureogranulatus]|nr:hypothetical protein NMY22_g12298 [Coprinellus aureogranulatus]
MDSFTELALSLEVDVTQFNKASQFDYLVEFSAPVILLHDTLPASATIVAKPHSEEPPKAPSSLLLLTISPSLSNSLTLSSLVFGNNNTMDSRLLRFELLQCSASYDLYDFTTFTNLWWFPSPLIGYCQGRRRVGTSKALLVERRAIGAHCARKGSKCKDARSIYYPTASSTQFPSILSLQFAMKPLHPEFPPIAFLAALSLLLPLPWHWRAQNVATLSIIAWLFTSNVIYGVDAAIWGDNGNIVGLVWCDITTKLIIGSNLAVPSACLCLCIHLEQVSSPRMGNTTLQDKRRKQWFEAGMCIGLPVVFMALHTIVQGHRFDIIQGYGCRPATYFSIPAIFIVWLPPIVMATACLVLSAISLRNFVIRRLTFAADLRSKSTGLNPSRYLRLISMAITLMVWSLGVTSYALYVTTVGIPLRPWTTWADVHSDFNRADVYFMALSPQKLQNVSYALWWMDAMEEYKKCIKWVKETVFRIKPTDARTKLKMKVKGLSFVNLDFLSSKPAVLPKISKPVLQSITSLDYALPPYETIYHTACTTQTFGSMSSTGNTDTTLQGHPGSCSNDDGEIKYHERKGYDTSPCFTDNLTGSPTRHSFQFQQARAIGSYSDLSNHSPQTSTGVSPSSTLLGVVNPSEKSKEGLFISSSTTSSMRSPSRSLDAPQLEARTPLPPIPAPPPAHEPTRTPRVRRTRLRPLVLAGSEQHARSLTDAHSPSQHQDIRSAGTTDDQS